MAGEGGMGAVDERGRAAAESEGKAGGREHDRALLGGGDAEGSGDRAAVRAVSSR